MEIKLSAISSDIVSEYLPPISKEHVTEDKAFFFFVLMITKFVCIFLVFM
jgi:hypothetical protein